MKRFFWIGLLFLGIFRCTIDPLGPPKAPKFYQKLSFPLTDISLPLANLVDSTNHIFGDPIGDSLYFFFTGPLDTVRLTKEMFQIKGGVHLGFNQTFTDIQESGVALDTTIDEEVKLSQVLNLPVYLPHYEDITVDSVPRRNILDRSSEIQVFDPYSIPYFEKVEYLTIQEGSVIIEITNQLLVDLDSVAIVFKNQDGTIIFETYYDIVPAGQTVVSGFPGDINGKELQSKIILKMVAILAGTHQTPLVIPAGSNPYVKIDIGLKLNRIESFTGIPKPIVLVETTPLPYTQNIIFSAQLGQTVNDPIDTNRLNFSFTNTLPFSLRFKITFNNFYLNDTPLVIDTVIAANTSLNFGKRLDNYLFLNPQKGEPIKRIQANIEVGFVPDPINGLVTIPLDIGDKGVNGEVNLGCLAFHSLEGLINETITVPPMSIKNIPHGLSDVRFKKVDLILNFYNQIRATTNLDLTFTGFREGKASEEKCIIKGGIAKATNEKPISQSRIVSDISNLFNFFPDSIIGQGIITIPSSDTSYLEVGKALWGSFELRTPLIMELKPIAIMPVFSSRLNPIDEDTRKKIKSGLIEAEVITRVINDFPISGKVQILMSNYDYFPLTRDKLDSGYIWINDTLYAQKDTGLFKIVIDTLAQLILPRAELDATGRVMKPGVKLQASRIDSTLIEAILRKEVHYIRPRVSIDGTKDFVHIGYWDKVHIISLLRFTIDGSKVLSPEESEEESPPATSSPYTIIYQTNPQVKILPELRNGTVAD